MSTFTEKAINSQHSIRDAETFKHSMAAATDSLRAGNKKLQQDAEKQFTKNENPLRQSQYIDNGNNEKSPPPTTCNQLIQDMFGLSRDGMIRKGATRVSLRDALPEILRPTVFQIPPIPRPDHRKSPYAFNESGIQAAVTERRERRTRGEMIVVSNGRQARSYNDLYSLVITSTNDLTKREKDDSPSTEPLKQNQRQQQVLEALEKPGFIDRVRNALNYGKLPEQWIPNAVRMLAIADKKRQSISQR